MKAHLLITLLLIAGVCAWAVWRGAQVSRAIGAPDANPLGAPVLLSLERYQQAVLVAAIVVAASFFRAGRFAFSDLPPTLTASILSGAAVGAANVPAILNPQRVSDLIRTLEQSKREFLFANNSNSNESWRLDLLKAKGILSGVHDTSAWLIFSAALVAGMVLFVMFKRRLPEETE